MGTNELKEFVNNNKIIKNLYSTKTIEEYSKALYIELIKMNKNEILKFKN